MMKHWLMLNYSNSRLMSKAIPTDTSTTKTKSRLPVQPSLTSTTGTHASNSNELRCEFQRQSIVTLRSLIASWLAFRDDGGDKDDHKAPNWKLVTLLYNGWRRGLRMNAPKAQVLCLVQHLLGLFVDEEGVCPSTAKGGFKALLTRNHTTLHTHPDPARPMV